MPDTPQSKTVFIIEDDDQIAYLLTYMLEREGYTITAAIDGQIAHDMINEIDPPNLVLLDVMLPFIDGFDLIKHRRNQKDWNEVPVIMLSSKSVENNIVQALDAGANDYVIKPFQPMELLARIKRNL